MGIISDPVPVKLFIGMLSNEVPLLDELTQKLGHLYGAPDLESPVLPWKHSDYYTDEMGDDLRRKFLFFGRLINPGSIPEIKRKTNELEQAYLNPRGGRRINLDPGYLDSAKLVLVSTKDFSHRIYLGSGIYGEVTLIYTKTDYQPQPFTYRDYRSEEYRSLFREARALYKKGARSA